MSTTRFEKNITAFRRTTDQLLIVERHIISEHHAAFHMRGPAKSLIGSTWITVHPHAYVSIIGDLTTMVFNCHGARCWRAALSRFCRPDGEFDGYYIMQKARMGLDGFDPSEFSEDYARDWLLDTFKEDAREARKWGHEPRFSRETRRHLWDAVDTGEHYFYNELSDADPDAFDGGAPGRVARSNVIAGALAMQRLSELLDAEEDKLAAESQVTP